MSRRDSGGAKVAEDFGNLRGRDDNSYFIYMTSVNNFFEIGVGKIITLSQVDNILILGEP
jgi:hypothetical protein